MCEMFSDHEAIWWFLCISLLFFQTSLKIVHLFKPLFFSDLLYNRSQLPYCMTSPVSVGSQANLAVRAHPVLTLAKTGVRCIMGSVCSNVFLMLMIYIRAKYSYCSTLLIQDTNLIYWLLSQFKPWMLNSQRNTKNTYLAPCNTLHS